MTSANLPLELQSINPPSSPQECAEVAATIKEPQSKTEKYQLHLAQEYFRNHVLEFSKDELLAVFQNRFFHKQFIGKYAENLIDACINHQISYPVCLNIWNNDDYINKRLQKYLSILNDENNEKQLQFIFEKSEKSLTYFFNQSTSPSEALVNLVLAKNPEKILSIPNWCDAKKCEWITNHKQHLKDIIFKNNQKFISNTNLSKNLKQHIYNEVNQELINNNPNAESQIISKYHFANVLPYDYLEYTREKFPKFFMGLLQDTVSTSNNDGLILNGAQHILLFRSFNSLTEIKSLLEPHKDILCENVSEKIGLYRMKTDPFEYSLRNNRHLFFTAFSQQDSLSEKHEEILVSMAFACLKEKHKETNMREEKQTILFSWYPDIILNATNEQFNRYTKEITSGEKNNSLETEIKKIKMIRDLSSNLDEKPNSRNKLKI